jgi:hypothetical protein
VVVRTARTRKKTGETSRFERLFITSLTPDEADAPRVARLIRDHWGIENRNHWRRDACWGEDSRCRVRNSRTACALALLRSALLLPALTAGLPSLNALADRCAASYRYALSLLRMRDFHW